MPNVRTSIGRVRRTSAASPSEAGYIKDIQKSAKRIQSYVATALRGITDATPGAIIDALQRTIIPRSQELCPVLSGRLLNSAYTETRETARGPEVYFGYAKYGNPPYAVFVHEATWMRHAKGKSAKFLERAVTEELPVFEAVVRRNMYEAFLKRRPGQGNSGSSNA